MRKVKLHRLLERDDFFFEFATRPGATGLMGGDWPGIDGARGVNLC